MNKKNSFEEQLEYNKALFTKITNQDAMDFLERDKSGKDSLEILLLNKFSEKFDKVFVELVVKEAEKVNVSEERVISELNKNNKLMMLKKCAYAQFEILTSKVINDLEDKELVIINDSVFESLFKRSINLSEWFISINKGKVTNFIKVLNPSIRNIELKNISIWNKKDKQSLIASVQEETSVFENVILENVDKEVSEIIGKVIGDNKAAIFKNKFLEKSLNILKEEMNLTEKMIHFLHSSYSNKELIIEMGNYLQVSINDCFSRDEYLAQLHTNLVEKLSVEDFCSLSQKQFLEFTNGVGSNIHSSDTIIEKLLIDIAVANLGERKIEFKFDVIEDNLFSIDVKKLVGIGLLEELECVPSQKIITNFKMGKHIIDIVFKQSVVIEMIEKNKINNIQIINSENDDVIISLISTQTLPLDVSINRLLKDLSDISSFDEDTMIINKANNLVRQFILENTLEDNSDIVVKMRKKV